MSPEQDPARPRAPLDYETPDAERPMTPAERRRFERNLALVRRLIFTVRSCLPLLWRG